MNPFDVNLPIIYLSPGQLYIAEKPAIINTLLGSCVSICLYAKSLKVGGMCHCLLLSSSAKAMNQPFRYLDQTVKQMVLKMKEMKIPQDKIASKIFGGADMFKDTCCSKPTVGKQNIKAARNILKGYHIPIEKEHVGGAPGKKNLFSQRNRRGFPDENLFNPQGRKKSFFIISSIHQDKEYRPWLSRK